MPSLIVLIELVGIKQICSFIRKSLKRKNNSAGNFLLLSVVIGYVLANSHNTTHNNALCCVLQFQVSHPSSSLAACLTPA